jgi:hypothetical protein
MTCEEYRAALHRKLDQRDLGDLAPEFRGHADGCRECAEYTAAMLQIDRGLASIERVPLSEGLIKSLLDVPPSSLGKRPDLSWRPLIVRGLIYCVTALAIWGYSTLAPPPIQAGVRLALPCIGVLIFLLSALRPVIVGEN